LKPGSSSVAFQLAVTERLLPPFVASLISQLASTTSFVNAVPVNPVVKALPSARTAISSTVPVLTMVTGL
jgi:hypothetical protein